ncbi:hypothetical protein ACHAXN_000778 [Cyclotella atomus]
MCHRRSIKPSRLLRLIHISHHKAIKQRSRAGLQVINRHVHALLHLDYALHDITPEEEQEHEPFRPSSNKHSTLGAINIAMIIRASIRASSSESTDVLIFSRERFTMDSVPSRGTNQHLRPCHYLFRPEELFLYFMTRMKSGLPHVAMCKDIFGGSPKRWSPAWGYMLVYLDTRYMNIIGHQGLICFLDDFPSFYEAIQQKVMRDELHHNHDNTAVEFEGLNFLPFDIFGFVDCSIDKSSRPFSGPDGDYVGAPRKSQYYRTQRAFYTGYKKCDGIKVEIVLLPNGICTIFGPVSARLTDVSRGPDTVLNMSGLNRFLVQIQRNRPHQYQVFGDGIYCRWIAN